MASSTLAQWDPLLRDDYGDAIYNQLQSENNIQAMMAEDFDSDGWTGRKKVLPTKIGRNWSTGSIGAGGTLPPAGRSAYADFEVPIKDLYGRVGFERFVMEQSRSKKGSWVHVVPQEMDGLVEDMAFRRNQIGWHYGSGILARVDGALSGATTVVTKNPGNVTGTVNTNRFIYGDATSGMFLAFLHPSTNAIEGYATVTAVNANGLSFTVDTAVTCTDNAKIVTAQTATKHSLDKEPEGLLAGIDDGTYVGTYHALSRTTYPMLKSTVLSGVGTLSLDAMQQAIDAVSIKVGKSVDLFLCEHAVRRAYLMLLEADRRYTGADLKSPDGGTRAAKKPTGKQITFGDIPIMADRDAPYGCIFGLNKASWTRYVLRKPGWAEEGGGIIKHIAETDSFTAYYLLLENYHCHYPARNFRMEGITVNQLVVHSF